MKLSNIELAIEVAEHGAELVSLVCGGREYMWNADPVFWNRHAPILFPAVGKPFNKEVRIGGKVRPMGQHGFARDCEFKEIAPLIHDGLYYRLTSPFDSPVAAWASVSEDQKEVLLNAVQLEIHGNMPVTYVRLQGLRPGAIYENIVTGDRYASDALMDTGMPIPVEYREYYSYRYRLRLCEET